MPTPRTAEWLALVVLFTPASAAAQLGADLPDGTRPAQWRVIWHEDPAHAAIVAWTTDEDGASILHVDVADRGEAPSAYAQHLPCETERVTLSLDYVHRCALTGLLPDTAYHFLMETDGDLGPPLYFVTAPEDDAPFELLFGGDSRSDSTQRREVNRRIAALVTAHPGIIGFAHGGDYIERGTSWSQWRQWLSDHELTTGPDGRVLPVIPTRGNHEAIGALYDEIWGAPGGDGNYYVTTIGAFALVTLNTETSMAGDQRDWLEARLADLVTRMRWVTAQYHRPAWPAVKQPSGAKRHWVPLFERYDLDLVFESDGHVLKRTVPIRAEAQDPTGVVYVGEGGLGVGQRTPDTSRWYLAAPGFAASAHHVQHVTVRPDAIEYVALGADGAELDRVTRAPRPARATAPPAPDAGVADAGAAADAGAPPGADASAPDAAEAPDAGASTAADAGAPDGAPEDASPPAEPAGCRSADAVPFGAGLGLLAVAFAALRRRRQR